ncbi:MAG: DUF5591 domain-containing protein [Methanoregula sp.]|nr:DUF5591 domain-containing protein [Methanoregula sp.]
MGAHKDPPGSETGQQDILTYPPFYLKEFETSYRYIIDTYEVAPRDIAIFLPCAIRKPYSSSPSHQLIRMVISQVFDPSQYHIVVFGTCGIVPAELEEMYPFAHYKYMLGKCKDKKVLEDFLRIETGRIAGYLDKTRHVYQYDLVLPTRDMINKIIEEEDCVFEEGSLSMEEYLGEFCDELVGFRNAHYGAGRYSSSY